MAEATPSRLALYRGLIALAWADGVLGVEETAKLVDLIDGNIHFSESQKTLLKSEIESPATLEEVWPAISEPQDRARLLDWANTIFSQDGEFCDDEQALYDRYLKKHLASIDASAAIADLEDFSTEQKELRLIEQAELKRYARQYGLMGRMERLFGRDDDADLGAA